MDTIIQPSFTVGATRGPLGDGTITNAALGQHTEILFSQLEPTYRYKQKNAEVFFAANQAATTTTIALATTYTGLVVYNPSTSKKNLSIIAVSCSLWAAPAGIVSVGLIGGWAAAGIATHTTPASIYSAKTLAATTSAQGVGADAAATLVGTPLWLEMINMANTSAALSVAGSPCTHMINGRFEVKPGGYFAIGTQTVASVVASIMWVEVDP